MQEEERVTRQSVLSPVMPSPCVNRSLQPSQAFSPMMRTVSRESQPGQPGGAFSPVFSTVGSQFSPDQSGYSPVTVNPQPAGPPLSPLLPSLSRNIQFNNSVRPSFPVVSRNLETNNTLSPVTPTVETRHRPGLTPGLPSLHLSPPSPLSPTPPTPPSPSPSVAGGRTKFVFKPRPDSTTATVAAASQSSSPPSQPASQQIVASLMSDLDTSDIWGDF